MTTHSILRRNNTIKTKFKKAMAGCFIAIGIITTAQADSFISAGVPAVPNMWVGEPIILTKNQESISIIETSTNLSKKDVYKFYMKALPNFGWKKITHSTYERKGALLNIYIKRQDKDGTTVEFTISVK